MEMKIVGVTIGIFVAIVLVAGLLIPAIGMADDAVTTEYKQPERAIPMTLDETASFNGTITATSGEITMGDKTYTMPDYTAIFMLTDKFVFYTAGNQTVFLNFWNETAQKGLSYGGGSTITITISDKDVDISYIAADTTEYTVSIEDISWIAYRDDDGEYYSGFFAEYTNQIAYYKDVNQIRAVNYIQTTNGWFSMIGTDVLVNMTDDVTATNTATADSNGVYALDISRTTGDITFDVDNNGTPYTVHPWIWLIPGDFTVENGGMHGTLALLAVIPVMVIVAIVVGVVALIFRSKLE